MNKYRLVNQLDEHDVFECLNCFNRFIYNEGLPHQKWKCCPYCLTIWDGIFNKQHKKYNLNTYNWKDTKTNGYELNGSNIGYCYRSRLIIEYRTLQTKELSKDGFFAVACNKWSEWTSSTHGELGIFTNDMSMAVFMFKKFKEIKGGMFRNRTQYRLILKEGNSIKILKEKEFWS